MRKGPLRNAEGSLLHLLGRLCWKHEADLTRCPVCHTPLDESTEEWRGAQHKQRMITDQQRDGSATCRRRHPFRALSMSRPLQHMQNLKPIFILFRPWGIGQGRKRKNSVFLVMIIGTFGVNIEGNLKTGFGVQPAIETTVLWKPPPHPRLLHTDRVESSLGNTLVSKSL